jgi:alpha-L-fucosidase 2
MMGRYTKIHLTGAIFAAVLMVSAGASPAFAADLTLRYDRPAQDWESQALPIGNGRIGAMLFGSLPQDRVQFNEISLWTGNEDVMGAYQAFGNLYINLPGHDLASVTEYSRELDLSRGIAAMGYRKDGVTYRREYLASHPAQVLVVHLSADKPGAYTGEIELADMHNAPTTVEGNRMTSSGVLTLEMARQAARRGRGGQAAPPPLPAAGGTDTMHYESQAIVLNDGGSLSVSGDKIAFRGCDALTILLGAGTSYVMDYEKKFQGEHPHKRLTAQMNAASTMSFQQLRDEHIKDYLSLFARVELDLGATSSQRRALTTDQRMKVYAEKGDDPGLEAMLFQFGRYLLMSCSRDRLPANLQGLWNDRNNPPWNADYHTNINIQMNYWPAEPANLSECHVPLFDLVRALMVPFQKATAAQFPAPDGKPMRGWTVRTSHNIFGNMSYVWNMGGNAWYAQHFWEHYAFTLDRKFLSDVAYPVMKEACEFWQDHLKVLEDGRLAIPNGWSPEHGPRDVDGVTYDQMMVWDLFTNTIEAADILGTDGEFRDTVAAMRQKLVGPKIGCWGQLQEWMEDIDDPNDRHRHTSHLFGVFPGRQISVTQTPELAKAARVSLEARGSSGDSRRQWAWAWRCALWARLRQGERAHEMVRGLFTYNTLTNLLGNHPPMQMDGNWGITAAICETLMQSHTGQIDLLPALPSAWPSGSVKGLCARGGFELDIRWKNGKLAGVTVRSTGGQTCRLRCADKVAGVTLSAGESCLLDGALNRL